MPTRIGWCSTAIEAAICFPPPERYTPPRDQNAGNRGYLSCPSVRGYFSYSYCIQAPFSLQLSSKVVNGRLRIEPVFPFTSLSEQKVREFVTIEPRSSWRNPAIAVLQLPSPYLFFADDPVLICQEPVVLSSLDSLAWRLIPGSFNIHDWQRPLNFAVEWHMDAGDFIMRCGDPIYLVSFHVAGTLGHENVELVECELDAKLAERLRLTRGVTAIRRGVTPLFEAAGSKRLGQKLLPQ